ncbi:hypothetical protein [Stappia sp.]|uniref:hypothetical protein n=1 Tax=Stappia sp. TaxID=1870903 RepID=UPI003D13F29A
MLNKLVDEMRYSGRFAWVSAKKTLGISPKSDKAHLCERIVRGIARGRIHPDSAFTAGIRPDGLGAVMIQRLSIQAAASDMGFAYYHKPFDFVGHQEMELEAWVRHCEAEFDLGHGLPQSAECELPYVEFLDYAVDERLWREPHLIGFREMFRYCNARPHLMDSLPWGARYRARARMHVRSAPDTCRVAVHVRRGDVSRAETTKRFTPNAAILRSIEGVVRELEACGLAHEVEIHSNGSPEELREFLDRGYRISDAPGAIESFRSLVTADVLVMAKSTFSYVAGLAASGVVVYEPQDYARVPRWVERNGDGTIVDEQLREALARLGPRG